jgi:hypothetical protein
MAIKTFILEAVDGFAPQFGGVKKIFEGSGNPELDRVILLASVRPPQA